MRLTKSDPTGSYSYLADGVSPASDVLSERGSGGNPGGECFTDCRCQPASCLPAAVRSRAVDDAAA